MREKTQNQDMCVYCGKPITSQQRPCKGLPDGKKAHLTCCIDHIYDDEIENRR